MGLFEGWTFDCSVGGLSLVPDVFSLRCLGLGVVMPNSDTDRPLVLSGLLPHGTRMQITHSELTGLTLVGHTSDLRTLAVQILMALEKWDALSESAPVNPC